MLLYALTMVLLAVGAVNGQVDYTYNCNQDATPCAGAGGVCAEDGTCTTCPNGREGYMCHLVNADLNQNDCGTETCPGGELCYDGVAGDSIIQCSCSQDLTGLTCGTNRIFVNCAEGSMVFSVTPLANNFGGALLAKPWADNVTECQLSLVAGSNAVPGEATYTRNFSHVDGVCGNATIDGIVGDETFTRCIYLAHTGAGLFSEFDHRICGSCSANPNTVTKTAGTVTITNIDGAVNQINKGSLNQDDIAMTMESAGAEITNGEEVAFAQNVLLRFKLTEFGLAKSFTSLRVESCQVSNSLNSSADGYRSMNFVSNSCPADVFEKAANLKGAVVNPSEVTFTFEAFRLFGPLLDLAFTCNILACTDNAACVPVECNGETPATGVGRKKRQVDGKTKEETFTRYISIVEPRQTERGSQRGEGVGPVEEEKPCSMSWEITATIVALSVGLLLVLILCVILIVKAVLNRRGNQTVYRDQSNMSSTASLPHLPTIVSNKC